MRPLLHIPLVLTVVYLTSCRAKILRNNALMTKMMSHFQKDNALSVEPTEAPRENNRPEEQPQNILELMQNVLCKNFPSIPCNLIMQDDTLRKLMERSIQQITYKKMNMDKTTISPGFELTLFPMINSEDLSNFLQVSNTGYFNKDKPNSQNSQNNKRKKKNVGPKTLKNFWSHEKQSKKKIKGSKDGKRPELYTGRKKIRKFYPHKIKYKDKNSRSTKSEFRDYSDEKLSMSVEVPDMASIRKPNQHLTYKVDSDDPPVWRIDYMKHGEPSLNMFAYEDDRLRGKIMQTGPNVIVDENVLEQAARKEVLHPDVYIKKKFTRKASVNANMEEVD